MRISKLYKKIKNSILYQIITSLNKKNLRVNTLIIGGQRCASTSMINFLSKLENVVTPKNNEQLFFFSNRFNDSKNYKDYNIKFLYNFLKKRGQKDIYLEKTPEYCLENQYLERICNYNNKMKIIFIFREPYSRIRSAFQLYKKLNYDGNFNDFISKDEEKYNVLKFSKYKSIYDKIFANFDYTNVLLLNFNDINTQLTKKKISKFLDINLDNIEFPKSNSFSLNKIENYKSEIIKIHGTTLEDDFKIFLNLYKEYEIKFNKYFNI